MKKLIILQLNLFFILIVVTSYAQQGNFPNSTQTDTAFLFEGLNLENKNAAYENDYIRGMDIANRLYINGDHLASASWLKSVVNLPNLSTPEKINAYSRLSYLSSISGDYITALEMHVKAIRLTEDEVVAAKLKIVIANTYLALLDHKQALKTVNASIQVLKKNSSYFWVAMGLGVKANIYKSLKQEEKALKYYRESAEYNEKPDPCHQAETLESRNTTLNNIANTFLALGRADSALYYLNKIKPGLDSTSEYIKTAVYLNYGEAYASLDDPITALSYIKKGLRLAEYGNMYDLKVTAFRSLATLYVHQGNYQKAYEYQKRYQDLYEESISEDNIHKIGQLHTRYALEKKDKEMAQKELQYNIRQLALQRRNNQLYLWIVSIGLSVLIVGILLRNQYNKNRFLKLQLKNAANENLLNQVQASLRGEETERERIARELHDHVMSELMATQLNLKDIEHYHPELKASSRYENILIQMEETTELLRRTTHNMMPVGLKETGLATTIEAFLYRVSNHRLMISFQCFGEKKKLADSTEKILLSITHELVQNVVKHAHATEALVQLNYYSDSLSLTVEDNGVGMPTQDETRDDGLGWHNIHRNVAALSGTVDIQSSEQEGTTVLIEIPL